MGGLCSSLRPRPSRPLSRVDSSGVGRSLTAHGKMRLIQTEQRPRSIRDHHRSPRWSSFFGTVQCDTFPASLTNHLVDRCSDAVIQDHAEKRWAAFNLHALSLWRSGLAMPACFRCFCGTKVSQPHSFPANRCGPLTLILGPLDCSLPSASQI